MGRPKPGAPGRASALVRAERSSRAREARLSERSGWAEVLIELAATGLSEGAGARGGEADPHPRYAAHFCGSVRHERREHLRPKTDLRSHRDQDDRAVRASRARL